MRTNTITIIALSAVMVSCQDRFQEKGVFTESQEIEVTATFAEGSTKTVLSDNEKSVLWSPNDTIAVFYGKNAKGRFISQNSEPEATVKFKGKFNNHVDYLNPSSLFFGLYPYDENAECDGETVTTKIPTMQYAVPGTFARGMFPTVAVSENLSLAFWSVCGGVCFTLSRSDINKVEITSNNGEAIAGKIRLSFREDGTPSAEVINGASGVTISPQSGDCFMSGQLYFASLLPADLSGGLTISFYTSSWQRGSYRISEPVTVKRSVFGKLTEKDKNCEWSNVESDFSSSGTANCYLVSRAGAYKFKADVRGGSEIPVGNVTKAEAIWESFGTEEIPSVGDLIRAISYKDGYVHFSTPPSLRNGNALIAVKDETGTILWSWHIWICDGFDPSSTAQVYYNDAGTMMDRNLGATSATPGDVGALGLLYQWGRKDPFLTSCSISSDWEPSASTLENWPFQVFEGLSEDFTISHPTTKVGIYEHPGWPGSSIQKGVHDPCPYGWRVPDGGNQGVWAKALGTTSSCLFEVPWDNINRGMNFGSENGFPKSRQLGDSPTIWYPAAGWSPENNGSARTINTGEDGFYWSVENQSYSLLIISNDMYGDGTYDDPVIYPGGSNVIGACYSVRCVRDTLSPSPQQPSLPEYALVGEFSVAPDRKVHFSKGNLQATIDASRIPTAWKFAANQYDYLGSLSNAGDDFDLFAWSTDAISNNWGIHFYNISEGYTTGNFKDWGVNIGDGNTWRTLTKEEWQYLFNNGNYQSDIRKNKYKYNIEVCGKVLCTVLLPDSWQWGQNGVGSTWQTAYPEKSTENYPVSWKTMEAAGAVCLPAAGYRFWTVASGGNDYGIYWSSSLYDSDCAYCVYFDGDTVNPSLSDSRSLGHSVRLVTEPGYVSVSGVSISSTTLSLAIGETAQLSATVSPSTATNKKVEWSSDNTSAVTVDNDGNVCAIGAGNATITVTTTDGGKTASCKVTVKSKPSLPTGALAGEFSVSGTKKVHFSQGNLIATIDASGAPTAWKFAANQYDYIGNAIANNSIGSTAGDIDLFGWSTASTTYGISTSTSSSSYSGDFVDWGKAYCEKNNITPDNTWRTLSEDEWTYLFNTRTVNGGKGAGKSYSYNITYGGKMGVVLYPDDYTGSVLSGTVDSLPEGVVFLPAAGDRSGSNVISVGLIGFYWSSTALFSNSAYYVDFNRDNVNPDFGDYRNYGFSVRLITESK